MPKFSLPLNFTLIKQAIYEKLLHKKTVLNKLSAAKNIGESPSNCNDFFRDCCGCCNCCPICTSTGSCNMQVSVATSNLICTSEPGCDAASGDFEMGVNSVGAMPYILSEESGFKNPIDLFSGVCQWVYSGPFIHCHTENCDACDCTLENLSEGVWCDPLDPIFISCSNDNTLHENLNCSLCEIPVYCTADLYPDDLFPCQCLPDIFSGTGYSCQCRGICQCNYDDNIGFLEIRVLIYITDDLSSIAITVGVLFDLYFSMGQHLIPISGGDDQIDCLTEINSLTIPLTRQYGSSILCTEITSVTLDLM